LRAVPGSFFHVQDLVNETTSTVKFALPFEDFTASPLPGTLDAYFEYRQRAIEFSNGTAPCACPWAAPAAALVR
jgi:hypothetical protein